MQQQQQGREQLILARAAAPSLEQMPKQVVTIWLIKDFLSDPAQRGKCVVVYVVL